MKIKTKLYNLYHSSWQKSGNFICTTNNLDECLKHINVTRINHDNKPLVLGFNCHHEPVVPQGHLRGQKNSDNELFLIGNAVMEKN
tara:strand:+ start:663 stop:920 length:258 start_codon:yes stop_codon:yes gene_type:complete